VRFAGEKPLARPTAVVSGWLAPLSAASGVRV